MRGGEVRANGVVLAHGRGDRPRARDASRSSASASGSTRRSPRSPRTRSTTFARRASCSPGRSSSRDVRTDVSRPPRADRRPRHDLPPRPAHAARLHPGHAPGARRRRRRRGRDPRGGLQAGHGPRRHGLGHRRGARPAAPRSSSTPTPTAARPAPSGSSGSASSPIVAPAVGTSQDVAMLLAHEKGAELIVSRRRPLQPDRVPGQEPRRDVVDLPHPAADRRDAWSTPRASAASTTRASAAGTCRAFLAASRRADRDRRRQLAGARRALRPRLAEDQGHAESVSAERA